MTPEFRAWPKIPRLNRTVTITEKIDGTNACVIVPEDPEDGIWAQSRNRIITPASDNYGFAAWVRDHAEELRELGVGYHFGEWYGRGIQRGYGLDHRRFALFNTFRPADTLPACVEQVPVLDTYELGRADSLDSVDAWVAWLRDMGSQAARGFMNPEGIVVYHHAAKQNFKVLLEGDDVPKGLAA